MSEPLSPAEEAVRDAIWIRLDGHEWAKSNYDGATRDAIAELTPLIAAKTLRDFADDLRSKVASESYCSEDDDSGMKLAASIADDDAVALEGEQDHA